MLEGLHVYTTSVDNEVTVLAIWRFKWVIETTLWTQTLHWYTGTSAMSHAIEVLSH